MAGREYVTEISVPESGGGGRVAMHSPGLPADPLPETEQETEAMTEQQLPSVEPEQEAGADCAGGCAEYRPDAVCGDHALWNAPPEPEQEAEAG